MRCCRSGFGWQKFTERRRNVLNPRRRHPQRRRLVTKLKQKLNRQPIRSLMPTTLPRIRSGHSSARLVPGSPANCGADRATAGQQSTAI